MHFFVYTHWGSGSLVADDTAASGGEKTITSLAKEFWAVTQGIAANCRLLRR